MLGLATLFFMSTSVGAAATEPAPRNPFLAASYCPIGHCSSSQQDSFATPGPRSTTRELSPGEIDYAPVGQLHMSPATSGPYPDGGRVIWSNGVDRIAKVDYESFEVLAEYFFPDVDRTTEEEAEEHIARVNRDNDGICGVWNALRYAMTLGGLSGLYTLLDVDHTYFIGSRDGVISAYGEADPSDRASPIVGLREYQLPAEIEGSMVGMNMTFDGWLIVATERGWVVAVARDFSTHRAVRMRHAEAAEVSKDTAFGWIRNGLAVDAQGGIYVASRDHLHKVVWTGDRLSVQPEDGAWTARYPNSWGRGSGATPSLMGFGPNEDHLVVISDGEEVMNVTLFWRDAIPDGWSGLAGEGERRIAGRAPANLGDAELTSFQTEQSMVVGGYGVLVVNNTPRGRPWYLPESPRLDFLVLLGLMGSHPAHQPFGAQKFEWDPATRRFESSWVNQTVSSPNGVPGVSLGSESVYLVGARDNRWTLESIDWNSGASRFHWVMGDQRYNGLGSAVVIDAEGRIHFGGIWGRVRLPATPKPKEL